MTRTLLDAGLPHGRLWVMERGCECDECMEARRRRAFNAHAETRDMEARDLPRARREAQARWGRPRWTKFHGRWAITEPPTDELVASMTVNVVNVKTGRTKEVRLGRLAGEKEVERDVFLRVFWPAY